MQLHQPLALTAMQRRVLELSATGMPAADVADRLDIEPDEVRRHVASAMAALGASSKLEAVVLALRQGLIDLPAS